MSIFDKVRQSDDAFVDELEYNMARDNGTSSDVVAQAAPLANSYPMLSRDAAGNVFEMPEYPDIIEALREFYPETADASIVEAQSAAEVALESAVSEAGTEIGTADRRDHLANIERALLHAYLLSSGGVPHTPDTHFDVEGSGIRFSDILSHAWEQSALAKSVASPAMNAAAGENTGKEPQASAGSAPKPSPEEDKVRDIPEAVQEKQGPEEASLAAREVLGAEQSAADKPDPEVDPVEAAEAPEESVQLDEQAGDESADDPEAATADISNGPSDLVLSGLSYRVRLPEADGELLVGRNVLHETLMAMPQDELNTLRKRRNGFAALAMVEALKHIDQDKTTEADIEELYKSMGSAYFGTQLARANLGLDEEAGVRATIEGSPFLDNLFQSVLQSSALELASSDTDPATRSAAEDAIYMDRKPQALSPDLDQADEVVAGKSLADTIVDTTPGERKQDDLDATSTLNRSFVMNGDEMPDPGPQKALSVEEQMDIMGFPKRPKLWPAVMSWPMQPDFDLLVRGKPSQAQVDAYVKSMKDMQQAMLERAEQINEYIHKNNPVDERVMWLHRRQSRKHLKTTVDDPHYGIRWASLIDEKSTRPSSAIVREWAHHRATTNDGGIVVADRDSIGFKNVTKQAVALSIQEGVARGWGSFKMQGDHRFTAAAIEAAKQANVKAVITELYGPWNLFKRKHTVMPTPPGVQNAMPRVETENVGPTPDDPNARKLITEEQRRADLAEEVTRQMSVEDKRNTLAGLATLPAAGADKPVPVPVPVHEDEQDPFDVLDTPEADQPNAATTRVVQEDEEGIKWTDDGNPDAGRDMERGPQMA